MIKYYILSIGTLPKVEGLNSTRLPKKSLAFNIPTARTFLLRATSWNISVVVIHGRILQHTLSTGLDMCRHFPHVHHSSGPCGSWGGCSSSLLFLCSKHLANSTPPLSWSNSTSKVSCSWAFKLWTSALCVVVMHSGHYIYALTFTSSLLARTAAWTWELLWLSSAGGLFLHGPDCDLQEQRDVQNCPFPLHGHLFALWQVDLHWQTYVQNVKRLEKFLHAVLIKPEFRYHYHCYCLRQWETLCLQVRLRPSMFQQALRSFWNLIYAHYT